MAVAIAYRRGKISAMSAALCAAELGRLAVGAKGLEINRAGIRRVGLGGRGVTATDAKPHWVLTSARSPLL